MGSCIIFGTAAACSVVCPKAYHVHIRSTSHNQKMAEAKKQKAKKQSTSTVPEASSVPANTASVGDESTSTGTPGPSFSAVPLYHLLQM